MSEIINKLSEMYPNLYHMAVSGSYSSIKAHGLRSSAELCALVSRTEEEKMQLLRKLRRESIYIGDTEFGPIILRDQKPMIAASLSGSLTDMTPEDWLSLLNSRTFFWPTKERLRTMMSARPYRELQHEVFVFKTQTLLNAYVDNAWVSPINSGATIPWKHPRGSSTFTRLKDFDLAARLEVANRKSAVAEFVLDCRLHPVSDHLIDHKTIGLSGIDALP